jgi:hypothetical protein
VRLLVAVLWLLMGLATAWSADLRVRPPVKAVYLCPHTKIVWGWWQPQPQPQPWKKVTGVGF